LTIDNFFVGLRPEAPNLQSEYDHCVGQVMGLANMQIVAL
jgi:hypothetical protein